MFHCILTRQCKSVSHFISTLIATKPSQLHTVHRRFISKMCDDIYLKRARECVPPLTNNLHKGQLGRIGVFGGSTDYTGAPYFAAISALKVGADLVHVFCCAGAAIPIKSYSPELMVHPVLDDPNDAMKLIEPWLERLHVLVIGPGLGRDPAVLATIRQLITACRSLKKPLVLDADALFLISQDLSIITNYPGAILTPNVVEFSRIFGEDDFEKKLNEIGSSVTVLKKGFGDTIYSGPTKIEDAYTVQGGNGRRCGGQGDVLAGSTAIFYAWAIKAQDPEPEKIACVAASHFVKKLNTATFGAKGRSMTVTDMIQNIHRVFDEHFEQKEHFYAG